MPQEEQAESVQQKTALEERAGMRGEILAELESLDKPQAPPEEKAESEAEPEEQQEEEQTDDGESEGSEEQQEETHDESESSDPELAKRLEAIQKAEKRSKSLLDKEREDFRRELAQERERLIADRARLNPLVERIERFSDLEKRVSSNPLAVLKQLGYPDERLEELSKQAYYLSKGATEDPKYREAAAKEQRQWEHADELAATRRELKELKDEIRKEREAADNQRKLSAYLDQVSSAVGEETPIVANMLKANKDRTLDRLRETIGQLIELTGEVPEPVQVAKALEESRRKDLEDAGVDLKAILKKKPKPNEEKKQAAKTLSSDLGKPTKPKDKPRTREEELEQLRKDLEDGKIDL